MASTDSGAEFNYLKFEQELARSISLKNSRFALASERLLNGIYERTGQRKPEARCELESSDSGRSKIIFKSPDGKKFDPVEECFPRTIKEINSPERYPVIEVVREDRQAKSLAASNKIYIPDSWLRQEHKHQGLKVLHELSHLLLYREAPSLQYVKDDVLGQRLMTERLLFNPKTTNEEIINELESLISDGVMSNLGLSDPESRRSYFLDQLSNIRYIASQDENGLSIMYRQVSLLDYEIEAKTERLVWAKALGMARVARTIGVVIDNRPIQQIFEEIDRALATRVRPDSTRIIHGKSAREKLGLPTELEKPNLLVTTPTESITAAYKELEEIRQRADKELRDYLHLNDERIRKNQTRLTPFSLIDRRRIVEGSWLFSDPKPAKVDEDMEAIIKLCCLAFRDNAQQFQEKQWQEGQSYLNREEKDRWGWAKDMILVGNVNLSKIYGLDNRHSLAFRTANTGGLNPPERIESNTIYFDRNLTTDQLEAQPAPIDQDGNSYLFGFRRTPEGGSKQTGWQIIGELMSIRSQAETYGQQNGITQNKVAKYLEHVGYSPTTIDEMRIGYSGGFAGFLED